MSASCEIAVVGGGIAGAALAAALARSGFDVRLVERGPAPPPFDAAAWDPRVYAIAPQAVRFLEALDVWPQIAATRAQAIDAMHVWDRDPAAGLRFESASVGSSALGWIVEHRLLAAALWASLDPHIVMAGRGVAAAEFGDGAVRLHLDGGATLDARLAIGAEGAESPLRMAAGIDTAGWSYEATAVVCHLVSSIPHHGDALQRFLDSGPLALLPLPDGRRSLVWSVPREEADALVALDDAAFAARLSAAVQDAAGRLSAPTRRLGFPLRLMHAKRYVSARFALVGDAAHVIHPLAGQGLNLGLADAQALATILGEARAAGRDWASERSLSRYERERQGANLEMMALTDALHRAFRLGLPGLGTILSRGLNLVDRLAPVKRALIRRAQG